MLIVKAHSISGLIISKDTFATENVQIAVELTRLMEAANRSAKEARMIRLADLDA